MRFYIDTSIWIDFIEDRKGFYGEPLGSFAYSFFSKLKENKSVIIISDFLLFELSHRILGKEIEVIMAFFKKQIKKVIVLKEQDAEAQKLSKEKNIPFGDALHAVVARDNDAVIISRDKHFIQLRDIVETYKPEEIT